MSNDLTKAIYEKVPSLFPISSFSHLQSRLDADLVADGLSLKTLEQSGYRAFKDNVITSLMLDIGAFTYKLVVTQNADGNSFTITYETEAISNPQPITIFIKDSDIAYHWDDTGKEYLETIDLSLVQSKIAEHQFSSWMYELISDFVSNTSLMFRLERFNDDYEAFESIIEDIKRFIERSSSTSSHPYAFSTIDSAKNAIAKITSKGNSLVATIATEEDLTDLNTYTISFKNGRYEMYSDFLGVAYSLNYRSTKHINIAASWIVDAIRFEQA